MENKTTLAKMLQTIRERTTFEQQLTVNIFQYLLDRSVEPNPDIPPTENGVKAIQQKYLMMTHELVSLISEIANLTKEENNEI